jgi:hypothetical protein
MRTVLDLVIGTTAEEAQVLVQAVLMLHRKRFTVLANHGIS